MNINLRKVKKITRVDKMKKGGCGMRMSFAVSLVPRSRALVNVDKRSVNEFFHSRRHPKDTIKTHVSSSSVPTFATDGAGQTSHSRTLVAMIDSTSAHPQAVANFATLETQPIFATLSVTN